MHVGLRAFPKVLTITSIRAEMMAEPRGQDAIVEFV